MNPSCAYLFIKIYNVDLHNMFPNPPSAISNGIHIL